MTGGAQPDPNHTGPWMPLHRFPSQPPAEEPTVVAPYLGSIPPRPAPHRPLHRGRWSAARLGAAAAVLAAAALLITGLWKPGFLLRPTLDVERVQAGVTHVLSDPTDGYGIAGVTDTVCNNAANPTARPGSTFTCHTTIAGTAHNLTVTVQDRAGNYTVGLPQ